MRSPANIVLIGFMGSGKTSVGRLVANRLGMSFVDMDEIIEQRQEKSISQIFATQGEAAFRTIEHQLVQELADQSDRVISPGGGIVLNPDNINAFQRTSLVICLSATPQTILKRVEHETHRPLLAGQDKLARIKGILEQRQALYAAIPHQVDTNPLTVEQVADEVVRLYHEATGFPS